MDQSVMIKNDLALEESLEKIIKYIILPQSSLR